MNFFTLFFLVAVAFEAALGEYIRSCGPSVVAPPIVAPSCCAADVVFSTPAIAAPAIIQSNSVASSLADTLSLLTVSSLLAEKLPLAGTVVANVPVTAGCGCGYGYGPYGYVL
ncbi:unnamed protein product, partial [Iphiclides podalirius]